MIASASSKAALGAVRGTRASTSRLVANAPTIGAQISRSSSICATSSQAQASPSHAPPHGLSSAATQAAAASAASSSSKPGSDPKKSSGGDGAGGNPKGSVRWPVKTTLYILLSSSVVLTGLGLYQYYNSFQTWPKEMREDLRAAIKFRRDGEWKGSELKFRSAIATASRLEPGALGEGALLKMTGLWIALASMFEESNQPDKAYNAYAEGFKLCLTDTDKQSVEGRDGPERARAVAVSQKLGELALKIADLGPNSAALAEAKAASGTPAERVMRGLGGESQEATKAAEEAAQNSEYTLLPDPIPFETRKEAADAAERHLVWSVEELLRLSVPSEVQAAVAASRQADGTTEAQPQSRTSSPQPTVASLSELDLPPWVTQMDLLASLESLGAFYARAGKTEYAVTLFLQVLDLLIPTRPTSPGQQPRPAPSVSDRCRAAVVMNNISQVFVEGEEAGGEEFQKARAAQGGKVGQATAWAKKGLDLVQSTNSKCGWAFARDGGDTKDAAAVAAASADQADPLRVEEVRRECHFAEIALLINLGSLSMMAEDKCAARNYLQRAYRFAHQQGYREARNRAASLLRNLERR